MLSELSAALHLKLENKGEMQLESVHIMRFVSNIFASPDKLNRSRTIVINRLRPLRLQNST